MREGTCEVKYYDVTSPSTYQRNQLEGSGYGSKTGGYKKHFRRPRDAEESKENKNDKDGNKARYH